MTEKLLQEILTELRGVKSDVSGLKSDMTGLKSEVADIKSDITGLTSEVAGIKSDMTGLKSEVMGIKSDMTGLKSEVSSIKSQLEENTQMTRAIFDRQEETDARLENLTLDVHKMHGEITATKENLAELKDEVKFTIQKTSENEMNIFKIRQHII